MHLLSNLSLTLFVGESFARATHYASGGLVVTGSEDNTCRVFRPDGAGLQTIPHPGRNNGGLNARTNSFFC